MADAIADKAAALLQSIQTKPGDCPQAEMAKLRPVCTLAEENYQTLLGLIKKMKDAESVLQKPRGGEPASPDTIEEAKSLFQDAKESYLELGNQINEGIKPVHGMAKVYVEDLLVQNLYKTYLAKLLCSLETLNPVEPFVRRHADGSFVFDREEMLLNDEDERRGLTLVRKKNELQDTVQRAVVMLECRYQKRLLANRVKAGESTNKIVRKLQALAIQDPEDLHTHIWIANLLTKELSRENNQNTRVTLRDDILNHCKKAFSLIDDFLNLQGIQNLNERDRRRSEYVKTITQIRKPLVR